MHFHNSTLHVEIVSWNKYNPRADAKKWSWFRFQNDFFDDEDLCDLSAAHLLVFVYLCCYRAKTLSPVFEVKVRHCALKARTSIEDAERAILTLVERGLIVLHAQPSQEVPERTDPNADVRERTEPSGSVLGLFPTVTVTATNTEAPTELPPLKPPRKREGPKRAKRRSEGAALKQLAVELVSRAVRARRECADEEGALHLLGPPGFDALLSKYASWEGFCRAYAKSYERGDATSFEAQLRDTFVALLPAAMKAYAIEPINHGERAHAE
jgi:hypothetical protein